MILAAIMALVALLIFFLGVTICRHDQNGKVYVKDLLILSLVSIIPGVNGIVVLMMFFYLAKHDALPSLPGQKTISKFLDKETFFSVKD